VSLYDSETPRPTKIMLTETNRLALKMIAREQHKTLTMLCNEMVDAFLKEYKCQLSK